MEAYLDNSATTPLCKEAVEKVNFTLTSCWGNPSSLHSNGIAASELLEESRNIIAGKLVQAVFNKRVCINYTVVGISGNS